MFLLETVKSFNMADIFTVGWIKLHKLAKETKAKNKTSKQKTPVFLIIATIVSVPLSKKKKVPILVIGLGKKVLMFGLKWKKKKNDRDGTVV